MTRRRGMTFGRFALVVAAFAACLALGTAAHAQTVVDVRLAYNLTVDQREADALEAVLTDCPAGAPLGCEGQTVTMTDDDPAPPPVQAFKNCTELRGAGWSQGVNRNGGTYGDSWSEAEKQTYSLNTKSDRDKDGHACE